MRPTEGLVATARDLPSQVARARRLAKAGDLVVGTEPAAAAVPEVEFLVESTAKEATEAAAIAKGTGDRLQGARGAARTNDPAGDES